MISMWGISAREDNGGTFKELGHLPVAVHIAETSEWVACQQPERSPETGGCRFHMECSKCDLLAEVAFKNGFISERFRNFVIEARSRRQLLEEEIADGA